MDKKGRRFLFSFLTPFVNPHQEKILKVLASTNGISYMSSRQFLETEYVRVLLYPDYFEPGFSDFELSLQEIVYPNKFERLTHAKNIRDCFKSARNR